MDKELRKALQEADGEEVSQAAVATIVNPGELADTGELVDIEVELGLPRIEGEDDANYSDRLIKSLEASVVDESKSVYATGKRLVILADERLYQEETFDKFVSSHKTSGWGRSKIAEVMSQVRDFLLGSVYKVDEYRLAKIGWRKMQEVHGVIKDGIIDAETALADAEVLSVQDLVKNKKDWRLDHAKAMGLAPASVASCLACMELREWSENDDGRVLMFGEKIATTEVTSSDNSESTTCPVMGASSEHLRVGKITYCAASKRLLKVNGKLTRTEAEARAESCPYYKEQF